MSLSAIIVMLASIVALWGVATWALLYTLRLEEKKQALIARQGGYECYSPRAFRDLERSIERGRAAGAQMERMRECRQEQLDALQKYGARLYHWRARDLPPKPGA